MISTRGLTWDQPTCYGTLTIDGVAMIGPAWYVDLAPLWGTPALFGSDKPLPDAEVVPYPRKATTTRYALPLWVNGHWDRLGVEVAPAGNVYAQLEANVGYLNANVLVSPTAGAGLRTVTWTKPSGAVVTVQAHVLGNPNPTLRPGPVLSGSVELSVPQGDLLLL